MADKTTLIAVAIFAVVVLGFGGFLLAARHGVGSSSTAASVNTAETTTAVVETNHGAITIALYDELAPKTVENFVALAEDGFYDGTKFHRVVDGFVIQGGDPLTKDDALKDRWGTGGATYTFADEIHAKNRNRTGTIAMANAGPDTNSSQFFINTADNNFLDDKHTVFGKVTNGMDVVRAIENVATDDRDRPVEGVVVEGIAVSAE